MSLGFAASLPAREAERWEWGLWCRVSLWLVMGPFASSITSGPRLPALWPVMVEEESCGIR